MKPQTAMEGMASNSTTKSSYNYEVFSCPTPESLLKRLNENKDRVGFYWYMIPQSQGCILVVATANLDVINARTKPRIELGLQPLTEKQAKEAVVAGVIEHSAPRHSPDAVADIIEIYLTLAYEQGYELCKRVEKEA